MLALFTIGFGRPDLLFHQKRLLDKYLDDEFGLCLIDNTPGIMRNRMERVCRDNGIGYLHTPLGKTDHADGLNFAALHVTEVDCGDYYGFLDADIFPCKHTNLIPKIDKSGFFGLPQTYGPMGFRYLWPGFCFFSKEWLNGRKINFEGIRTHDRRQDGDCGSMMHDMFTPDDWLKTHLISLGYGTIRPQIEEDENIQSWGYELIDDWVHFTNSSNWLRIPSPLDRDRRLIQMVSCL